MKKLPIGIQDFRELREGGNLYIDKTPYIYRLIESGKYYFLSRPRRFGKSLTLSVIKELFQGSRELFDDLWAAERWDWAERYPVVHISFSKMDYQGVGMEEAILLTLEQAAVANRINLEAATIKQKFEELLKKLSVQGKVVLLIDEYDKPLIDYIDDLDKAKENQKILKVFYSIIKDSDPYLRFLLVTGVSKFSKVSIFSDLNNLQVPGRLYRKRGQRVRRPAGRRGANQHPHLYIRIQTRPKRRRSYVPNPGEGLCRQVPA
ncbi:MAG: AAA family ATPase [Phaeodactylibacter sp.]|nr:AAA family ATPase [Phaeodactylibacter sp.]